MASPVLPASNIRTVVAENSCFDLKPGLAGGGALCIGLLLVRVFPALQIEGFARAAAQLAGFFTGAPVSRGETGWIVLLAGAPVAVTIACSATDYFLIVAGLLGFQTARLGTNPFTAAALGFAAAAPIAIFVNAVRIITAAYAHPLIISRLPTAYEPFLHMAVGAGVFLPSLILLNLLLETYGRHRCHRLHLVRA